MQNKKLFSVLVAVAMFATIMTAAGFVSDTEASQSQEDWLSEINVDSTLTAIGEMNVYVYSSVTGTGWHTYGVTAFDACQAVLNANNQIGSGNLSYDIEPFNNLILDPIYGDYYEINPLYGQVNEFLGLTNGPSYMWYVYVYVEESWTLVPNNGEGLGFYRPFEDYATADHQTANVALAYLSISGKDPGRPVATQALTTITLTSDFEVNFIIKDIYGPFHFDIEITGFGSDVYAALKNALVPFGNVVVGEGFAGPYYSWVDSILGLANAEWPDWYPYWGFYLDEYDVLNPMDNYGLYLSGFYTPLDMGYVYYDEILEEDVDTGNCHDAWFLYIWP